MIFFNKRAQSTAEYALVIAIVIGAAIAMQVYVRRGLQGGVKFVTDKLKKDDLGTSTGQYEPYYTRTHTTSGQTQMWSSEETKAGGEVVRQTGNPADAGQRTQREYSSKMRDLTQKD